MLRNWVRQASSPEELLTAVSAAPAGAADNVLAETSLASVLEDLRAAGQRIVMTNGCFDLIHPRPCPLSTAGEGSG